MSNIFFSVSGGHITLQENMSLYIRFHFESEYIGLSEQDWNLVGMK
jgi:hypothetical protein